MNPPADRFPGADDPSEAGAFLAGTRPVAANAAARLVSDARDRHHERTVRQLAARLEAVAGVTERSLAGARPLAPQVLALEAATRHAVELGVLARDEAEAIWAEVADRHPGVAWCRAGCADLAA